MGRRPGRRLHLQVPQRRAGLPGVRLRAAGLQDGLRQPIQGWMGRRDPFAMGPGYVPAAGVRALVSGTPPILAMVPLLPRWTCSRRPAIAAVRAKSMA